MKIIGITGGVGSGKTYVAGVLAQEFGACVILTDTVAHELMEKGQDCYHKIVREFGPGILNPEGGLDKARLSALIFKDPQKRIKINQIVHPAVKAEVKRRINNTDRELIVIESALLFEDHYEEICDEVWYVHASKAERVKRLMDSRGYTREKCEDIMRSQWTEEEFLKASHRVIFNEDDSLSAAEQIRGLLNEMNNRKGQVIE